MEYAIDIIGLSKEFYPLGRYSIKNFFCLKNKPNKIVACCDINLKIKKGELFGLVGPNGAGKTTLIKVLATIILPDSGSVSVNGYDLLRDADLVRSSIGLVTSETKSFYGRLTGRENLYFFANLHNLFSKQKKKRVEELAQVLGIVEELDKMYQQYSTGMKQRLAIVRGLLNDAPILLIDEPTKSLDPISAQDLRRFIKDELVDKSGKTIIFSSHSLSEIETLSDRIAIMSKGRIKAEGTLAKLKEKMGPSSHVIEEVFSYYLQS
ncbi:MAG: ABC transporter ATP-binding protein [Candidatus Omnitrophota bacterium]|nr:ABC transporter ATP-binding protein [Candidatus Omnitrophota bacterium]